MFKIFGKPKQLSDLKVIARPPLGTLRERVPIVAIDDKGFVYLNVLRNHGFNIKELLDVTDKMRSLVRHVFYNKDGSRNAQEFKELKGEFDDPRVIEMYELAADSNSKKPWSQRVNHWVHEYHYDFEALDYISAQFSNPQWVAGYLNPRKD
jgi:hypothetical protein